MLPRIRQHPVPEIDRLPGTHPDRVITYHHLQRYGLRSSAALIKRDVYSALYGQLLDHLTEIQWRDDLLTLHKAMKTLGFFSAGFLLVEKNEIASILTPNKAKLYIDNLKGKHRLVIGRKSRENQQLRRDIQQYCCSRITNGTLPEERVLYWQQKYKMQYDCVRQWRHKKYRIAYAVSHLLKVSLPRNKSTKADAAYTARFEQAAAEAERMVIARNHDILEKEEILPLAKKYRLWAEVTEQQERAATKLARHFVGHIIESDPMIFRYRRVHRAICCELERVKATHLTKTQLQKILIEECCDDPAAVNIISRLMPDVAYADCQL